MFGVYHGIGFDSGPVKFEPSPLLCLTVKDAELLRPGINYFNIGSSLYVSAARAWRRASLIRKEKHTFLLTGMKPVGAYHTAAASYRIPCHLQFSRAALHRRLHRRAQVDVLLLLLLLTRLRIHLFRPGRHRAAHLRALSLCLQA